MAIIRCLALIAATLCAVLFCSSFVAQDCSKAPSSWGGADASTYKQWCEDCGGTFGMNPNPSCTRGPNWGGRSSSGSSNSGAFNAYEQDRQRREAEERRVREQQAADEAARSAAEKKQKDDDFKRKQAEIFGSMKTIEAQLGANTTPSTTDLKDIDIAPPTKPQAKPSGPDCGGTPVDSKTVDLRCLGLNPDEPIKIDPWVVKGKERVFPAQPDPATFLNLNYNKGFESLMKFDPVSAVRYFEIARQQRPKDPLVRNALLLAQDLVKAHEKKDREDKARAEYWRLHTFACLGKGEQGEALAAITRAGDLDPKNDRIRALTSVTNWIAKATNPMDPPQKQKAYKLVGHSIYQMNLQQFDASVDTLEFAQKLAPNDADIAAILKLARSYAGEKRTTAAGHEDAARKDILDKASKN